MPMLLMHSLVFLSQAGLDISVLQFCLRSKPTLHLSVALGQGLATVAQLILEAG